MYENFKWARGSWRRNELLRRYEPLQPFVLLEFVKQYPRPTFFDVGANIGAYSCLIGQYSQTDEVIAFEPAPRTFAILTRNLALNELNKTVQAIPKAASDSAGSKAFEVVSDTSGANAITSTSIHEGAAGKAITVDTARLDDFITASRYAVLKIDVEGHEHNALLGARQLLQVKTCVVQMEKLESANSEAINTLQSFGYKPLFHFGADGYFSNDPAHDPSQLLRIVENATSEMIAFQAGKRLSPAGDSRPLRARPLPSVTVELTGNLARLIRRQMP